MKRLAILALLVAAPALANGADPEAQSRALADRFQGALMSQLQAAIADRGVAGAVGACTTMAPAVAAELSTQSGATVRRTAIRTRNPLAKPDGYEAWALAVLDQQPMSGGKPREISGWVPEQGGAAFRYLRAIPMGGVCLACHGSDIAPDVKAAIAAAYPQDEATGFKPGQLRGAFSIRWEKAALGGL